MSVTMEVRLLSGRAALIEAGLDEELDALILRAQTVLGVRKGRLVDSSGQILDACALVRDTPLQNGDSLTLHISPVQVCRAKHAFAADASVVTSGSCWRAFTAVQNQLKNVQQIQATDWAFAAILGDRSVVTWGDAGCGGDSSAV